MASFQDHINKAKTNFQFLEKVNSLNIECVDWQVTVSFYTSLHLINAYLAKEGNIHYTKHKDVRLIIWFDNSTSPFRLDENTCLKYRALENLSRRSRYMCHDDDSQRNTEVNKARAFLTNEKHLVKAIRYLDELIAVFDEKYELGIEPIKFVSRELPLTNSLKYFNSKVTSPLK